MHDLLKVVIRRPDWKEWAHIPSVGLKSAVSLSLDIEPRCVEKQFTAWWGKVEKDSCKQQIIEGLSEFEGFEYFGEWVSRLNIAVSNLERGIQVTARPRPRHWVVVGGLREDSEVDLVGFGRFMESIGRKLPEGFPVAKDIAKPIPELRRETALLANPPQQQEPLTQPAHDSLDNPGGDFDSDGEFSRKERNKMLAVLLVMAMDKYGYDPKKRNSAARKISEAAQLRGISVTDDTIKKYLNEAFEKSLA